MLATDTDTSGFSDQTLHMFPLYMSLEGRPPGCSIRLALLPSADEL